ncbi:unnamed protein product [Lampetra planeri]
MSSDRIARSRRKAAVRRPEGFGGGRSPPPPHARRRPADLGSIPRAALFPHDAGCLLEWAAARTGASAGALRVTARLAEVPRKASGEKCREGSACPVAAWSGRREAGVGSRGSSLGVWERQARVSWCRRVIVVVR